tara:strand:- start:5518 stop:6213 length:696 start_codon:yes stop_codon:yes gene_type:complete
MLNIKGFQKTSLIDYPDKVSSIIFLSGCNMRCPYCQNRDLVVNHEKLPDIEEKDVLDYLKAKSKWLDGVVITGGEPSLHDGLKEFIRKVKQLNFLVKLDTNGTNPGVLKELVDENLLDYVAMDIKAPLERYDEVAKVKINKEDVQRSVDIIRSSDVDYEFRMTCTPSLIKKEDIIKIREWLKGSKRFIFQQFSNKTTLDKSFEKEKAYSKEKLNMFKDMLKADIEHTEVRA